MQCRWQDRSNRCDEKQLVWPSPSGLLGSLVVQLSFVCMCSEGEQGIKIVGRGPSFALPPDRGSLDSLVPRPSCLVPQGTDSTRLSFDPPVQKVTHYNRLQSTEHRARVARSIDLMADTLAGRLACHGEDGRVDGGKSEVTEVSVRVVLEVIERPVEVA